MPNPVAMLRVGAGGGDGVGNYLNTRASVADKLGSGDGDGGN